jgi:hypothetical protein
VHLVVVWPSLRYEPQICTALLARQSEQKKFEEATDRLRDRAEDQQYAPNLAREVLNRGRSINAFMRNHRLGGQSESDLARVRNDLNRLANAYYVNW